MNRKGWMLRTFGGATGIFARQVSRARAMASALSAKNSLIHTGYCSSCELLLRSFPPQQKLSSSSSSSSCKPRLNVSATSAAAAATTTTTTTSSDAVQPYSRPLWSAFELGKRPVYWQASDGRLPRSGGTLTIFFNPEASQLTPNDYYGVAFNGGFNQPIMCGGEPRVMTRKDRYGASLPLFSIKINIPQHALSLEFSFTDGKDWDGPYKIELEMPPKWRNKPRAFFDKGLADELSRAGACEDAIYPEAVFVKSRCALPAYSTEALKCDLDLAPGCTDSDNPFYDPLAITDDGSCPYVEEGEQGQ